MLQKCPINLNQNLYSRKNAYPKSCDFRIHIVGRPFIILKLVSVFVMPFKTRSKFLNRYTWTKLSLQQEKLFKKITECNNNVPQIIHDIFLLNKKNVQQKVELFSYIWVFYNLKKSSINDKKKSNGIVIMPNSVNLTMSNKS